MADEQKSARIAAIEARLTQIDYSLAGAWRAPELSTAHLEGEQRILVAELAELQRE